MTVLLFIGRIYFRIPTVVKSKINNFFHDQAREFSLLKNFAYNFQKLRRNITPFKRFLLRNLKKWDRFVNKIFLLVIEKGFSFQVFSEKYF